FGLVALVRFAPWMGFLQLAFLVPQPWVDSAYLALDLYLLSVEPYCLCWILVCSYAFSFFCSSRPNGSSYPVRPHFRSHRRPISFVPPRAQRTPGFLVLHRLCSSRQTLWLLLYPKRSSFPLRERKTTSSS